MADKEAGYPGQQPADAHGSESNTMAFGAEQALGRMWTTKIVEVTKVTNSDGEVKASGFVDVRPLVRQMDGGGNTEPHGTIFRLPYVRSQGGKNAVINDPKVGDKGVAVFCDRDSSAVIDSKGEANPGSYRRFDPADGIYVGSMINEDPEQYLSFKDDGITQEDKHGNTIVMNGDALRIEDKLGNKIVLDDKGITLHPYNGQVYIEGNLQMSGNATAFNGDDSQTAVSLSGHIHEQQPDSHGDAEQDTNPPKRGPI
jgi:hypothetical protein